MFCIKCSTEIKTKEETCQKCGFKHNCLEETCQKCGFKHNCLEEPSALRRFAAHFLLDITLISYIFTFLTYTILFSILTKYDHAITVKVFQYTILAMLLLPTPFLAIYYLIDSFVYWCFGSTLGKYLFGIKIVDYEGNKISSSVYLKRNFRKILSLWWLGYFSLFPFIGCAVEVYKNGFTIYDQKLQVQVLKSNSTTLKTIIGVIICILILVVEFLSWRHIISR